MATGPATIDTVLPVHNEGASIGATLGEFYRVVMPVEALLAQAEN